MEEIVGVPTRNEVVDPTSYTMIERTDKLGTRSKGANCLRAMLKSGFIDYLLFAVAALNVVFWVPEGYINGISGDNGDQYPVYPIENFLERTFAWSSYDGGMPYLSLSKIPFFLLFALLSALGLNLTNINRVYIFLLRAFAGSAMCFLVSVALPTWKGKRIARIISGLVFMFNPFVMLLWGSSNWTVYWPIYIALPLLMALYIKGLKYSRRFNDMVRYSLLFALTSTILPITLPAYYPFVLAFLLLVSYTTYWFLRSKLTLRKTLKHLSKFVALCAIFSFLLNGYWILPMLPQLGAYASFLPTVPTPPYFLSVPLSKCLIQLGYWGFFEGYKGVPYFPYADFYLTNPVMVAVLFTLPALAFASLLLRNRDETVLFFGCLTVLGLFLYKGVQPPFGELYQFLLNIPLLKGIRQPHYFGFLVSIGYSYLIGVGIGSICWRLWRPKKSKYGVSTSSVPLASDKIHEALALLKKRRFLSSLMLLGVLCIAFLSSWPMLTGAVVNTRPWKVPGYYREVSTWLSQDLNNFRVFYLPMEITKPTYTSYKWGYGGATTIIHSLISKPVVVGVWGWKPQTFQIVNSTYTRFYTQNSTGKLMGLLDVKYVLLDKSVDTNSYDWPSLETNLKLIELQPGIRLISTHGEILVFENEFFVPHIYTTKSLLLTEDLKDMIKVVESDGWVPGKSVVLLRDQLSPSDYAFVEGLSEQDSEEEVIITVRKLSQTRYSCSVTATGPFFIILGESYDSNWKAYFGEMDWFRSLFMHPIPEERHYIANGYANAWYVERAGSYTITIFYQNQSLFYFGLLLSIVTICAALGFLIYGAFSNIQSGRCAGKTRRKTSSR